LHGLGDGHEFHAGGFVSVDEVAIQDLFRSIDIQHRTP
jgi:hypothetical protein